VRGRHGEGEKKGREGGMGEMVSKEPEEVEM